MNYAAIAKAVESGKTVRVFGKSKIYTLGYQEYARELTFHPASEFGRKIKWDVANVKWQVQCFRNDNRPWVAPLAWEIVEDA